MLFFVDLVSAFASTVRSIAVSNDGLKSVWECKLRDLGFEHVETQYILAENNPVHEPDFLEQILADMYDDSWASLKYSKGVIQFVTGSLAGTPRSDLICIRTLAIALRRILRTLEDNDIIPFFGASGASVFGGQSHQESEKHVKASPPAYVDDLAFIMHAPSGDLIAKVRKALSIIVCTFAIFGLEVNMSPGKTEILFLYRGHGSKKHS